MAKENLNIDEIVEMLLEGKSYREIAAEKKVAVSTLHNFTSKPEHSARAKEALKYSAFLWDEKAEQAINDIPANGSPAEIAKGRELKQLFQWRASKRNPKEYGDRVEVKQEVKVSQFSKELVFNVLPGVVPDGRSIEMPENKK